MYIGLNCLFEDPATAHAQRVGAALITIGDKDRKYVGCPGSTGAWCPSLEGLRKATERDSCAEEVKLNEEEKRRDRCQHEWASAV